jgi:hypothetical protein
VAGPVADGSSVEVSGSAAGMCPFAVVVGFWTLWIGCAAAGGLSVGLPCCRAFGSGVGVGGE